MLSSCKIIAIPQVHQALASPCLCSHFPITWLSSFFTWQTPVHPVKQPYLSKCGPWTSSFSSTWELGRNKNSQSSTLDPAEFKAWGWWPDCILTSSLGDSNQFWNLRATVLRHNSFINTHGTFHIPMLFTTYLPIQSFILFYNHI